MSADSEQSHQVRIGGLSKDELLLQLGHADVMLNEAARALFADARFAVSGVRSLVGTTSVAIGDLGLSSGATFSQVVEQAASQGLGLCPLELGPHLRLQFTSQAEGAVGRPVTRGCAPPGSLTVASEPLSEDDDTPKGFYLRRIEGRLWLRGYRSGPGHLWAPHDVMVFLRSRAVA